MQNLDSFTHTRGESIYLEDIPETMGTLYGSVFGSPMAHGKIIKLDLTDELNFIVIHRISHS